MISPSDVRRLGRYMLFDRIASGGMASVHFGRLLGEVGFARIVAIKRLHPNYARMPEFVAMFTDEARLAARIRHPNVVTTLDVVAEEGELFLVMEYVHGGSLSRLSLAAAKAGALLPPAITAAAVAGALYGLHAAHEAKSERGEPLGLVHRDVSPQNILVDVDGVPRVLDFGIAKAAWRLQTTMEGQLKGKLSYMAPEQISGRGSVDRRADIYSVSVVLWELLTGVRYIDTSDLVVATTQILERSATPPSATTPGLPPALDAVVLRGLSRDRSARFSTAKEMAAALEDAITPATAREVGEWVQAAAREALTARAALIATIEAQNLTASGSELPAPSTPRAMTPLSAIPTATSEAPTYVSASGRTPAPQSRPAARAAVDPQAAPDAGAPRAPDTIVMQAAPNPVDPYAPVTVLLETTPSSAAWRAQITTGPQAVPNLGALPPFEPPPTMVTPAVAYRPAADPGAAPPASSFRTRTFLVASAVSALVLLGAGLLVLSLQSRSGAPPTVSSVDPSAAPAPLEVPRSAAPSALPAPPSLPAPPPEGSAPRAASSAAAPAPPATARTAAPPQPARPPAEQRPPPAKGSCDPPFFITKDGTKKYKLECL